MNALVLAAALAMVFAAGYGILALLVRQRTRLSFAEQFALSWLFGTGVISLLIWFLGFFARGALLPGLVSVICLCLGFVGWKQTPLSRLRFPRGPLEILLAAIIATEIAVIFYLSFVHTLGWDGLFNWEIKARYAFANGGILPASYFRDSSRVFTHPEYPLAIPFTELWLYFWLGEPDQFWAKIIFPVFYVAEIFLLVGLGSRLTGKSWVGLLAAAFLFFIPQITVEGGSAVVGYVDFPLSVFYLATIGFLLGAIDQNDVVLFRIYAFCLALLPWVKRDGLILWVVAALCGAFAILRMKKPVAYLLMLVPGLVVIVGWHFYLRLIHVTVPTEFLPVTFATLRSHCYRVGPLLLALLDETKNFRTWGLFWVIAAVGCGYLIPRLRHPRAPILLTALLVPIGLYLFVYIFSNWPDYLRHVSLSIARLLMHVAPIGLLIAALAAATRAPAKILRRSDKRSLTCAGANSERTPAVEFA